MTTFCTFCGEQVATECPYEGLCAAGLNGQPITTIPKTGYVGTPRQKPKPKEVRQEIKQSKPLPPPQPKKPRVIAYDIYGKEIGTYKNVPHAAKDLKMDDSVIHNNLHGKRKNGITENGIVFKMEDKKRNIREARIIVRMAGDKEIGRYPTIIDAARRTGVKDFIIFKLCHGVYKYRLKPPYDFKYLTVQI